MYKHVIVVSHRRSGTHLAIDTIRNNSEVYGRDSATVDQLTLDHLCQGASPRVNLQDFTQNLSWTPHVFKTHAHADIQRFFGGDPGISSYVTDLFAKARIIYVYRNGRDVMTSLYHYCRTFMPELQHIPFSEFLRMDNDFDVNTYPAPMNRIQYWVYHTNSWLDRKDVLAVSFRQLVQNYDTTYKNIARFIGLPQPRKIVNVLRASSPITQLWRRLTNRIASPFSTASYSSVHFRRGSVGDSKTTFSPEDHEYFQSIARPVLDRLNSLKPFYRHRSST
jgi:hypothetical protein